MSSSSLRLLISWNSDSHDYDPKKPLIKLNSTILLCLVQTYFLYSQLEKRAGYARRGEKQIPKIY